MNSSPYLLIHVSMISLYQVEKNPKTFKENSFGTKLKKNEQIHFLDEKITLKMVSIEYKV